MNQIEIDFDALARRSDPQTSKEAARSSAVGDSFDIVRKILGESSVPLTSFEVGSRTDEISGSRVRGALATLQQIGEVVVVDDEGRSDFGRRCRRYTLAAKRSS